MSLVLMQLRAAVEAAARDKLAQVGSAIAKAYGAGGLTDGQYEELDGLLAARRQVAQAIPARSLTLAAACAQVLPAPSPAQGGGAAPARAHARTGSRPRKPESLGRRRHWAAAGYLPPKIAAGFTAGEQAVLAVVGKQMATRGSCTLAVGAIAALAGVGPTTVHRALRQAALMGLLTIELRRITGYRNDTNVLRIASAAWAAWLRVRLPRSARADLGGGYQTVQGTMIEVSRGPSTSRTQTETGPLHVRTTQQGQLRALQVPDPAATLA